MPFGWIFDSGAFIERSHTAFIDDSTRNIAFCKIQPFNMIHFDYFRNLKQLTYKWIINRKFNLRCN